MTPADVMARVREAYERSSLTLDELGRRMGYTAGRRQSAWAFIFLSTNPTADTLIRFAKAVGCQPADLFERAPAARRRQLVN